MFVSSGCRRDVNGALLGAGDDVGEPEFLDGVHHAVEDGGNLCLVNPAVGKLTEDLCIFVVDREADQPAARG